MEPIGWDVRRISTPPCRCFLTTIPTKPRCSCHTGANFLLCHSRRRSRPCLKTASAAALLANATREEPASMGLRPDNTRPPRRACLAHEVREDIAVGAAGPRRLRELRPDVGQPGAP